MASVYASNVSVDVELLMSGRFRRLSAKFCKLWSSLDEGEDGSGPVSTEAQSSWGTRNPRGPDKTCVLASWKIE
jgi:hypothetical protein